MMGLCACTATDVVSILRKKREPFAGVHVKAEAVRAEESPTVYTSIKLIYTVSGQVSRKAVEDAVRLSEKYWCQFGDAARVVQRTPSSSGTASRRTNCGSRSVPTAACGTRRCPRSGIDKAAATENGRQRQGHGVQLRRAPRAEGARPTLPFVIALVELEEGVRMLGELRNVDPASVEIGMPVRASISTSPANDTGRRGR